MAENNNIDLSGIAIFRELSKDALCRVAHVIARHSFAKGAIVFRRGDPGDALYGVISGEVRLSVEDIAGHEVFLNIMEPGEVFGEIAVIDGASRTGTAMAVTDASLFMIPRAQMLALLEREPALSLALLRVICQRLRWASDLIEEAAFLDVSARLASRLLRLSDHHGNAPLDGAALRISQGELANFLCASRQTVNRSLQVWRAKGWINVTRGAVTIRNPLALAAVARGAGDKAQHLL